jgi:hypothetical protein
VNATTRACPLSREHGGRLVCVGIDHQHWGLHGGGAEPVQGRKIALVTAGTMAEVSASLIPPGPENLRGWRAIAAADADPWDD